MTTSDPRPLNQWATFLGMQDDGCGGSFPLVNLLKEIPGHPVGSTIALETLLAAIGEREDASS